MKFSKGKVPESTLQELLVALACQGAFNRAFVPDWATGGTMFEEVFEALRELGDACDQEGGGIPEGFDEWFTLYCRGDNLCEPEDIESQMSEDDT